jgi:hypothetical protein
MADEVKAWTGWLHKELRRRAVNKLPVESRERYDEEWESAIEEIPGAILKLVYSMGLLRGALGIRRAALKNGANSVTRFALPKRLLDIAFSGVTLIVFAPLLLAIAIAIKLESRGPIVYSSERLGKNGRVFRCIKFRTMARNAGIRWAEPMEMDIANAPKVTHLGRFLRRFSFDELPQLINGLRGDMSIVGPRPLHR